MHGYVFHDTNGPNLGKTLTFYWNLDGEKVPSWECLFVHRKQGLFLSEYVEK